MTGGGRLSLTAIVAVVVCCSASALVGAGLVATGGGLLRNGLLIGAGLRPSRGSACGPTRG